MIEILILVGSLLVGLVLMVIASDRAVRNAETLALSLGVPQLLIGLFVLSIGTDMPEIAASLISAITGHGDIVAGDALGSCLTQITLVLGILPFLASKLKVKRENILYVGGGAVLSIVIAILVMQDGFISRLDALFLILSWAVLMFIISGRIKPVSKIPPNKTGLFRKVIYLLTDFAIVGFGAYITVTAIIGISNILGLPEFLISFFGASLGTSLPELAIDITAVRRKKFQLAVGDILGSNIVDATLALGAGPLIVPVMISAAIAVTTGWYVLLTTIIVVALLAYTKKLDRRIGLLLILIYLGAYLLIPFFDITGIIASIGWG